MTTPVPTGTSGLKIFGRDPVMWLAAIQSILAIAVTIPVVNEWVTPVLVAWLLTGTSAAFAALEAWSVRPVAPAMLSGAVRTTLTAAVLFGLPIPESTQAAVVAGVTMLFGFLTANGVTPNVSPDHSFVRAQLSARVARAPRH
jgi:hypothetical protein